MAYDIKEYLIQYEKEYNMGVQLWPENSNYNANNSDYLKGVANPCNFDIVAQNLEKKTYTVRLPATIINIRISYYEDRKHRRMH